MFRRLQLSGILLLFLVGSLELAASDHYLDTDEALALAFPRSGKIEVFVPTLTAEQARSVKSAARSKAHGKLKAVYVAHSEGVLDGISFIDSVRCRTLMMTFCMSFDAQGKIKRIDIMDYPEPKGKAVKGRKYLRRFNGRAHGERLRHGKEIPNIGGASLSCRAMVERARFLMAYHSIVLQQQAQTWLAGRESARKATLTEENVYTERSRILGEPVLRIRLSRFDHDLKKEQGAVESAFAMAEAWDRRLNTWNPESELSQVLAGNKKMQPMSRELAGCIDRIYYYHQLSKGAFDPSVKTLIQLWSQATTKEPTANEIAKVLTHVGLDGCEWIKDQRRLTIPSGMQWDVSAIAKGWIVEETAASLRQHAGELTGIISYGDSSYATIGESACVGIRDPQHSDRILGEIEIPKNHALATSGFNIRYFSIAGKKYHHLINPKNGRPLDNRRAATVLAADASQADALATLCCLLPRNQALAIINSTDGVEAMIWEQGEMVSSHQWPGFVSE